MKKVNTFLLMLVALSTAFQVLASEPRNYYNNALGKSDEALMNALNSIIHNHRQPMSIAMAISSISTATAGIGPATTVHRPPMWAKAITVNIVSPGAGLAVK